MRKAKGFIERPGGLVAYVKVNAVGQKTKQFPHGTSPEEIDVWRAQARLELKRQKPAKGTLASDIQTFLSTLPEGRRKTDFEVWLTKWEDSPLASKPRKALGREDFVKQFAAWQKDDYSGSSLNHLRQVFLSLWKHFEGPLGYAACPIRLIPKFQGAIPKQGFFEQAELEAVQEELSDDYRDVVAFAAFSGWRRQEIQGLTWDEVDLPGGVIRLSPERSKTREGRVLPIVGVIKEVIDNRLAKRETYGLKEVFGYVYGGKETRLRYRPVGDWRKAWDSACERAGVKGRTLHDFRRTVVRNLTRAGVPEKVAMGWTGHKTRSVFDRYNIVREEELRQAGAKLTGFTKNGLDKNNA